ncbi:MAG: AAA family ATPase [Nanoarchaeota archaeon]|nr:AAA family ATPase [Nanoarchaeota archaeon]
MEWYEKFDFFENPFETNLFNTDFSVIGLKEEKKEALYRVRSGTMLLIEGPEGSGKTAILKHIIDNFKGRGRLIYVNGNRLNKGLDVEKLIMKSSGMRGKVFKKKPKAMIFLLDNLESLSKKNARKIKYYFDQDYLRSVVFTTKDYSSLDIDDSIRDRIDKRLIKLSLPKKKELIELISMRLEGKELFSKEVLQEIAANSDSPKEALQNAEKIAKNIASKKDMDIKKVKELLEKEAKREDETDDDVFKCMECGKKMQQVGKYWVCPDCQDYCDSCGAGLDDEDEECPECGAKVEE